MGNNKKKLVKNKASVTVKKDPTVEEIQQLKKLSDNYQKQVLFWTYDNPQVIIERNEEFLAKVCTDIEKIMKEYEADDELCDKVGDLILHFRANIEGIEQWFKYSLALGHYDHI